LLAMVIRIGLIRRAFFTVLNPLLALLLNGCASVQPDLWPPAAGEHSYPIYVSLDTWHGMIGLPLTIDIERGAGGSERQRLGSTFEASQSAVRYEEWGYAERKWYVEGHQGIIGTLRALFWPTSGTVEIARYERLWASRTPQPPADLFLFHLSHDGWMRLRRHLLSTLAATEPIATVDRSEFYPSLRSYHIFHHCHHYVARALQEAGLPVSPFWAMNRTLLALQLGRAKRLAEEFMPLPSSSADARQLLAE